VNRTGEINRSEKIELEQAKCFVRLIEIDLVDKYIRTDGRCVYAVALGPSVEVAPP